MVNLFKIIAVILLGIAAIFLWRGNYDGVFVSAVLSSVSYFLSFRFEVKERLDAREAERLERELEEMSMNRSILQERPGLFETEEMEFEKRKEEILNEK